MLQVVPFDWTLFGPVLVLLATIVIALVVDMFGEPERWARPVGWVSLIGTLVALWWTVRLPAGVLSFGAAQDGLAVPLFVVDRWTRAFMGIALLGTALSILVAFGYLARHRIERGEYYILMLLSAVGMWLMAGSNDLILLFLGLELLSLPLYILAGFLRNAPSSEASLKYFLLGAFSSGFFLYGVAMIYGAVGSTNIGDVAAFEGGSNLFRLGMVLLVVGFGFKVAAVPFHQWTPDVYQGAPTAVTAFFASAPKVAGFAAVVRVFLASGSAYAQEWTALFAVLAALTMTVGNLIAVTQRNVKRMLAYSSVAHVGYVLVGLAAGPQALSSVAFYLLAYSLMSLGAFGVLVARGEADNEYLNLDDYAGLGFRRPFLAVGMTIFLVSLAGFPPTAGFLGKFLLFQDAYRAGLGWLVVLGVLNSVISAYYYLGVVVQMYMAEPAAEMRPGSLPARGLLTVVLLVSLVGLLVGGVLPVQLLELIGLSGTGWMTALVGS
ncbi:MAG: NADH-quinone oxidoreductase subunit N [Candidatus Poribacteria bacterium]|nr:MAG: NADH-quinone oxidoreductase subunit N [Candidatus Poribacteria bacterium]